MDFVATQLSALPPGSEFKMPFAGSAGHLQHEVHPGNHQVVLQEPELHVLSSNDGASVVGVRVHTQFVFHLRMDLAQPSVLNQQFQTLAPVKVVDEFPVVWDFGKGKTVDELALPEDAKT